MMHSFLFPGFFAGFGLLMLLGFLLTLYVLYDVFVNQEGMQLVEKLLWVAIVLAFNLLGVILYLFLVKSQDQYLLEEGH